MISHGNLVDSICQVLVVAEEVKKIPGVRISFLPSTLIMSDVAHAKVFGMEWPGRDERDFQRPADASYLWPPHCCI